MKQRKQRTDTQTNKQTDRNKGVRALDIQGCMRIKFGRGGCVLIVHRVRVCYLVGSRATSVPVMGAGDGYMRHAIISAHA